MDEGILKSILFYNLRQNFYNEMLKSCKDGITKIKDEPSFQLFQGIALILNHKIDEGVHILESIKEENEIQLATNVSFSYVQKYLPSYMETIDFDKEVNDLSKSATAVDYYHSAFVHYSFKNYPKAFIFIEKAIGKTKDDNFLALKGWICLELKKLGETTVSNISEIFEKILENNVRNLDAALGLTEAYLYESRYDDALKVINQFVVRYPNNEIPLIEKAKVLMAFQNWEQVTDVLQRAHNINEDNLNIPLINIVILLCVEDNSEKALLCIKKYVQLIDSIEPKNGKLLSESGYLFSIICKQNKDILDQTFKMLEKAVQINIDSVEFVVNAGRICVLQEHFKDALKYFKAANKIDASNADALIGLALVELNQNNGSSALKKQVEYLNDFKNASLMVELLYIKAKCAQPSDISEKYLTNICEIQFDKIKKVPYSTNYLKMLNPNFMMLVVKELLCHAPNITDFNTSPMITNKLTTAAKNVLSILIKACPGHEESVYLLAKTQYYTGDVQNAAINLKNILNKNCKVSDAYLLLAQIQVSNGDYERASQSLEVGLSHDFKLKENAMYYYTNGLVSKKLGNYQDSIRFFNQSIALVDQFQNDPGKKAVIYVELIDAYNQIGQTDEAIIRILDEATEALQKTPEEARILILCADQALNRKNIQAALDLLRRVKPSDSYYIQAKTKYANILLEYRRDRNAYLQCYEDMMNENPNSETYILYGDACMIILEPEKAIDAYSKALKENPKHPQLSIKMGETLVYAHYFKKAVAFYKEAIALTNNSDLKIQLADLYLQIREYKKSEALLLSEIEADNSQNLEDLAYLQFKTKVYNLLATVQEKSGQTLDSVQTLNDAKDNQNRVCKRLKIELANVPVNELDNFISICTKLAEMYINQKDNEKAIQIYKEALQTNPDDVKVAVDLAKLYMQMHYLELCQQTCSKILEIDPDNESASVIMADIAFYKIDFDMALFHFTQLVSKQPTNWVALVRMIEIMRRTGTLDDAPEYIKNAEKFCKNQQIGGLSYSTGLYQWYTGNLNSALRNFNLARQDSDWGQKAICNMIEICLNPEDELFADTFADEEDIEYKDSRTMALQTADRLLKELRQKLDESGEILKQKLLINFRLLATKDKYNIEKALESLISLASQPNYKDNVGVIFGLASAYTLLKQTQRAKNQLKRVIKSQWTFEEAEYLEKCWLMLAEHYVQSSKFDVATDLINKVVSHNKTSHKAFELLGLIAEKEQRYREASANYEQSWRYGGKCNPTVGYRLAHTLLKSKKFADAIDVGQQVLKLNPDNIKVKKDILDKAMNNLRI